MENYPDRKSGAAVGFYASRAADLYEPYVRPQHNGSRQDVRWGALTDRHGHGLVVVADPLMAFSALHHRDEDLDRARHVHKVKPRRDVVVCLDAAQMGLGGASCGPPPLDRDVLKAGPTVFRYSIRPVHGESGPALAALARLSLQAE